jgi:hypothetical protein
LRATGGPVAEHLPEHSNCSRLSRTRSPSGGVASMWSSCGSAHSARGLPLRRRSAPRTRRAPAAPRLKRASRLLEGSLH